MTKRAQEGGIYVNSMEGDEFSSTFSTFRSILAWFERIREGHLALARSKIDAYVPRIQNIAWNFYYSSVIHFWLE